jgi:hypothetical protein
MAVFYMESQECLSAWEHLVRGPCYGPRLVRNTLLAI